ncbi:MAG: site-specific integrase, partial [Muribaculaceae bacterium]|nr:site-specific integrase [Muribaculaceae bacterium]
MKQPRNTLSILYYLKRGHLNRNGECPVMCRISVRGEKETFSSHVYTSPDNWDVKSARVIGRTAKVIEQNKILTDLQVTLTRHYYDIEQRNGYVTAEMIKNAYMGITAKAESLLPIYKEFLEETEALIGIQKSKKTYEKYERCYRRVVEFLRDKYHVSDIAFRDLKPMFLVDFEVWLATKKNCSTNTIYKFLQLLRMPVLKAKRMGIVFKDPYEGYKMKKVSVDRGYLTEEEVIAIATHEITIPRLEQVRDIFIFCCYTGLAYSDVAALRQGNIQKMFDGRLWIVTHRQKTKTNVNVPLL